MHLGGHGSLGVNLHVGYVLYSLHVCVWAHQIRQLHLTIPLVVLFVSCALGSFLGGQVCPPLVTHNIRGNAPKCFFGRFFLFLADFAIFSGFTN
jgi:hypothetical protein